MRKFNLVATYLAVIVYDNHQCMFVSAKLLPGDLCCNPFNGS